MEQVLGSLHQPTEYVLCVGQHSTRIFWSACNEMHEIWTSKLSKPFKLSIFRAAVEPILLCGCETWTLSKAFEKWLDGTYTRLLMRVQNISWKSHPSRSQIYGNLPPISSLVQTRRVQFAGHCLRASEEIISSLLLWSPKIRTRGRKLSYPDVIARDTNLQREDLEAAMFGPGSLAQPCKIHYLDRCRTMMMMMMM